MSWIDKVQENLVIITGDGVTHKPLYIKANKLKEYNISEFNFRGIPGTYISRKLPLGRKYQMELIFQGVNHLDEAQSFEDSSDASSLPWQVVHPLYGSLLIQPSSLQFDNSELNLSRINATVFDTISIDKVNDIQKSAHREIVAQSEAVREAMLADVIAQVPSVSASEKVALLDQLSSSFTSTVSLVKESADYNKYINQFNATTSILNTVGSGTTSIATSVQRLTVMPYAFSDTIQARIAIFQTQFDVIKQSASNLFKRNSKKLLELQMGSIVASVSQSTVTNASYANADDVFEVLEGILRMYDDYIEVLDAIGSPTVSDPNSYIPNYDTVGQLQFLVGFVSGSLLAISQQTKVKYIVVLDKDYTIFEIVHKLYGMDNEDASLNRLIADNQLSHQQLFVLKAGTSIIYYK